MTTPTSVVEIDTEGKPAYCPNDAMPIWSSHPRVFLEFNDKGEARCPYCSTVYHLKHGAGTHHH